MKKNFFEKKSLAHLKPQTRQGFTYLESIVSTIVASMVALFLAGAIPIAYSLTNNSQETTISANLAQRYMEDTKNKLSTLAVYNQLQPGNNPPIPTSTASSCNDDNGVFCTSTSISNHFSINTNVKFIGGTSGTSNSLAQITVNVLNGTSSTASTTATLDTIIVKPTQ